MTDLRLARHELCLVRGARRAWPQQLDGVHATVNFAVERAHVEHDADVSAGDLIAAVESTGYHAEVAAARAAPTPSRPAVTQTTVTT